ncbi:MAG: hypothetical protein D6712_21040 [Chloroflexi bacterium]|nr:MAG: hypothetical protein D6712_21040 [Chloroflexota bacterium]
MDENVKLLKQVLRAAKTIIRNYTSVGRVVDIEKYKNGGFAFSSPLELKTSDMPDYVRHNYGAIDCIVDIIDGVINIIVSVEVPTALTKDDNTLEIEDKIKRRLATKLATKTEDLNIEFKSNYDGTLNLTVSARFVGKVLTDIISKGEGADIDIARELVGIAITEGIDRVTMALAYAFSDNT